MNLILAQSMALADNAFSQFKPLGNGYVTYPQLRVRVFKGSVPRFTDNNDISLDRSLRGNLKR